MNINSNIPDRLNVLQDKESIYFYEYQEELKLKKICDKISVFKSILRYIWG